MQTTTNVVRSIIAYETQKWLTKILRCNCFGCTKCLSVLSILKEGYLANIARAYSSFRSCQKQLEIYWLGQSSIIELNLENQQNIRAQAEKIQAEYTMIFQQIVLDYYLGVLSHK